MPLISAYSKTRRHGDRKKRSPCPAVSPCFLVYCFLVYLSTYPPHFPSFFLSSSTSTRRRNLPTWVFGSSERNSTCLGTL